MKRFFMKRFYNRFRKVRQNKKAISDALGRILRPDFRRWTQNFSSGKFWEKSLSYMASKTSKTDSL